jgi:hypothetical protein
MAKAKKHPTIKIFQLLFFIFLANVKGYAEKREARQDSMSSWSASFFFTLRV